MTSPLQEPHRLSVGAGPLAGGGERERYGVDPGHVPAATGQRDGVGSASAPEVECPTQAGVVVLLLLEERGQLGGTTLSSTLPGRDAEAVGECESPGHADLRCRGRRVINSFQYDWIEC